MGLIFPKMTARGSMIAKSIFKPPPAGVSTFPGPAKERDSDPDSADEYDTLSVDGLDNAEGDEESGNSIRDWENIENKEG